MKNQTLPKSICLTSALALAALSAGLALPRAVADDWPQWGGYDPGRNMYSPARGLPDSFDPGKFKPGTEEVDLRTTRNVKWVAKLGGQSYGNVTVSGGKVFIGTNNESPRDKKHVGDRSILMVFDEKTGEFLWQLVVPKLISGKVNDWEGLGLLSSPTVQGNRVYLVSSRCEVLCLDTEGMANGNDGPFKDEAQYIAGPGKPRIEPGPKDADIIWRYDMMDELGVFPHNASNCSLLIVDDILYACTSNGQDWTHSNIPSPNSPSFIALDKKTGEYLGEEDAKISARIFHGQWSSPSAGKVNGRQLVFWKNRVYVATGQDPEHGEGVGVLSCIDATRTGDITKTGAIWKYDKIHRSISTVSITPDGLLFVGDFSGFLHCLDAETGKVYWTHDLKSHAWGSTLAADGKVYIGDEDGDFTVLAASKEKKVISQVNLGAPVYSTPVVATGVIYVASNTHLFAFYDAARANRDEVPKLDLKK